jgi:protein-disulfide isomerase
MWMRVAAALLAATGVAAAEEPLFEYAGKAYASRDLSARMQQLYGSILVEQHQAMRTLVDEMVFDVYVEREAARQGRDVKEVGSELLAVPNPDDHAVRQFYDQNRNRITQPFGQVNDSLRKYLRREAVLERRNEVLRKIKSEGKFRLLLEPPPAPRMAIVTRGRPVKGDLSAPIELVEFADYQCPNCKRAVTLLKRLMEEHPGKLKLVFMDFPVNPSGISRRVAYGGVCAQAQGKFWDYHDLAYQEQESLSHDSPQQLAKSIGLDMSAFEGCMSDPSTRRKVAASEQEARRLGVTATPTLFVDGRPFPSNHLLRDLGAYISQEIGAGPS